MNSMGTKNPSYVAPFALVVASQLIACAGGHDGNAPDPSSWMESASGTRTADDVVDIVYRGQPVQAERIGDRLVIEGDILVAPSDLLAPQALTHDKGNSFWSASHNGKWPSNVVHYRVGDLLAINGCTNASGVAVNCNTRLSQAGYEQAIRDAMDDWERVSNVRFVRDTGASQANYVNIVGTDNRCASFVGRIGGSQQMDFSDRCAFNADGTRRFSIHHELAHAYGLFHEHQRTDRGTFVNVLNNVDTTDAVNYAIMGRSVGAYDCDSVMHYSASLSSKTDAMGNPVCVNMGQRDHLSEGDRAAANVLYPRVIPHFFVFANTGSQTLCRLNGRINDANTSFQAWLDSAAVSAPSLLTTGLVLGDHALRCRAQSCLWASGYTYPAASVTNPGTGCGTGQETFDETQTLRVANPGLMGALFTPPA